MSLMVLTLALAQAAAPARPEAVAAERAERAFFGQVSLAVAVDRSDYYVGEPVRLKVTMRNIGSTPVRGYLDVLPYADTTEIYYRRKGDAVQRFVVKRPNAEEVSTQFAPRPLEPGAEHTSEVALAFDPQRGATVLDRPGVYEFKVVYRGIRKIGGKPIESDVAAATSAAPPASHEDSLTRYVASGLPQLAQYDARTSVVDRATVIAAGDFLERYPQSPYATGIRQGLLQYLTERVDRRRATEEEKRLYEIIKGQEQQ